MALNVHLYFTNFAYEQNYFWCCFECGMMYDYDDGVVFCSQSFSLFSHFPSFALHFPSYCILYSHWQYQFDTSPHHTMYATTTAVSTPKQPFFPFACFLQHCFFGTLALLLCCYGRGRMAHSNSRFYVNMYVYLYYVLYILQRVSRKALHIFSLLNSGKQEKSYTQ